MGQTIEKMKQGNSNIRNEATAYALRYLNTLKTGVAVFLESLNQSMNVA